LFLLVVHCVTSMARSALQLYHLLRSRVAAMITALHQNGAGRETADGMASTANAHLIQRATRRLPCQQLWQCYLQKH